MNICHMFSSFNLMFVILCQRSKVEGRKSLVGMESGELTTPHPNVSTAECAKFAEKDSAYSASSAVYMGNGVAVVSRFPYPISRAFAPRLSNVVLSYQ